MHRLLITGNGFDIASGLPTKYTDFMKYMQGVEDAYRSKVKESSLAEILHEGKESGLGNRKISYTTLMREASRLAQLTDAEPMNVAYQKFEVFLEVFYGSASPFKDCLKGEALRKGLLQSKDENSETDAVKFEEYNACILCVLHYRNLWLDYFENLMRSGAGEKWIDFENEIFKVVQAVETLLEAQEDEGQAQKSGDTNQLLSIRDFMQQSRTKNPDIKLRGENGYIAILQSELSILVRCLEVYMLLVEQISPHFVQRIPVIQNLGMIHYQLNFNYTDTFLQQYVPKQKWESRQENIDFIHGRAGFANLILGVRETLGEEKANNLLDCSRFKKYFQRILYGTGMEYKTWFPAGRVMDPGMNVYIFGHSLDPTDGEVLSGIILNPNVKKTTIFYHDEMSHISLINNLTQVIGKDSLIRKTGNGEIVFQATG